MAGNPKIEIRLGGSDRARWDAAAEQQGMPLATWIRRCVEDALVICPGGDSVVGTAEATKRLMEDDAVTSPAIRARQKTTVCERERFHRPGAYCKTCGKSF